VVDDELAAVAEQLGEALPAAGRVERVGLVEPDPGQLAPQPADLVAGVGQFLFADQQRLARRDPIGL
jgi:hypothetical protein